MGISIPKVLQSSTVACPPSLNYIKQFIPDIEPNGIINNYKNKNNNNNIIPLNNNNKDIKENDLFNQERFKLHSQQGNNKFNPASNNTTNIPFSSINNNESRPYTTSGFSNVNQNNNNHNIKINDSKSNRVKK